MTDKKKGKKKGIDNIEIFKMIIYSTAFLIVVIFVGVAILKGLENAGINGVITEQINEGYWVFAIMLFAIFGTVLGISYSKD